LAYLTELAVHIKDEEPDGEEQVERKSFLNRQIGKIIQANDSVLATWLNSAPIRTNAIPETPIYPFDMNTSQKEAIRKALSHNISIIQGPPGTGKTQSILNLVANLACRGKSVSIVSNNNSVIENVKHKLEKAGYGFLVAHLGNNENKKRFFESLGNGFVPDPTWRQDSKTIESCRRELAKIDEWIDTLLREKEELAKLRELLPRLRHEQNLLHSTFDVYELPAEYVKLHRWDSERLGAFKTVLEYFPERGAWLSRLSMRMKYGNVFSLARHLPLFHQTICPVSAFEYPILVIERHVQHRISFQETYVEQKQDGFRDDQDDEPDSHRRQADGFIVRFAKITNFGIICDSFPQFRQGQDFVICNTNAIQ
jgi:RecA/RadA recombinase